MKKFVSAAITTFLTLMMLWLRILPVSEQNVNFSVEILLYIYTESSG